MRQILTCLLSLKMSPGYLHFLRTKSLLKHRKDVNVIDSLSHPCTIIQRYWFGNLCLSKGIKYSNSHKFTLNMCKVLIQLSKNFSHPRGQINCVLIQYLHKAMNHFWKEAILELKTLWPSDAGMEET